MLFKVGFIMGLWMSGTILEGVTKNSREPDENIMKKSGNMMHKKIWNPNEQTRVRKIRNEEILYHSSQFNEMNEGYDKSIKDQQKNNLCDLCTCTQPPGSRHTPYHVCNCHQKLPGKTFTNISELLSCIPRFPPSPLLRISLNISGFNFGVIPNGTFSDIPYLQTLILRQCNISTLEPNAFKGLTKLYSLTLVDSEGMLSLNYHLLHNCVIVKLLTLGKVRNIENDTFLGIKSLDQLTLEHNGILKHHQLFKPLKKLRVLMLNNIGLKHFPHTILSYLSNLEYLQMSHNEITSLQFKGDFSPRKLFTLFMIGNNIKSITRADMKQFSGVAKLSIFLDGNNIQKVEPNFLDDINQIIVFSVDNNRKFGTKNFIHLVESLKGLRIDHLVVSACGIVINKFDSSFLAPLNASKLKLLSLVSNIIDTFEADAFEPVKTLKTLEISNFLDISNESLLPLQDLGSLKIHDMVKLNRETTQVNVNLNALGKLNSLLLYELDFPRIVFTFSNRTSSFRNFSLVHLGEAFEQYHDQVLNLITKTFFDTLDLTGNLLFRYSDTELCELFNGVRTQYLYLNENYFKILPLCMFQNFSAQWLDLRKNRIIYIQEDLFKNVEAEIEGINLSENSISLIEGTALAGVTLFINLDFNSIECNCATQPFVNWLKHGKHQDTEIYHDKFCASSTGPTKDELLKLNLTWVQCNMEVFVRNISLMVSSVILIGILTASLLKYFWQDIKYIQMVRKAKRHNGYIPINGDNQNEFAADDVIQDNEVYDAFVSYHSEKRIWVRHVMTPELTEGDISFSLIHDDNIIPGQESYFGGLMSHMDRSRHIIFLVTRGWMKEGWNEFEMDSAIDMLTQTKRHTLIVILMENIPQKEMSHKLKLMVRHNVCLKWSEEEGKQRKFWRDLKLELGKKRYM